MNRNLIEYRDGRVLAERRKTNDKPLHVTSVKNGTEYKEDYRVEASKCMKTINDLKNKYKK